MCVSEVKHFNIMAIILWQVVRYVCFVFRRVAILANISPKAPACVYVTLWRQN